MYGDGHFLVEFSKLVSYSGITASTCLVGRKVPLDHDFMSAGITIEWQSLKKIDGSADLQYLFAA